MSLAHETKEPPLAVNLRAMKLADIDQVFMIEVASYAHPWPMSYFIDEITKNSYARYIVAEIGGQIVGYCGMWLMAGEAHITNIAVDFGFRRRKVAEQLIVDTIGHALDHHAETIFLEVRRYNLAAQRLYARYLFRPTRVREAYYQDNFEDAVEMRVESTSDEKFLLNFMRRRAELAALLAGRDIQSPTVAP